MSRVEEIESEVEQARFEVMETAAALKDRLTPSQLRYDLMHSEAARNVTRILPWAILGIAAIAAVRIFLDRSSKREEERMWETWV